MQCKPSSSSNDFLNVMDILMQNDILIVKFMKKFKKLRCGMFYFRPRTVERTVKFAVENIGECGLGLVNASS